MTPYYQDSSVTIYHGRAEDVLPTLEPVDLVLTDPPYGISDSPIQGQGRTGKRAGAVNQWHPETTWDDAINPEWCQLSCQAAFVVAWFGHWRKREEVEQAMTHPLRAEIIWVKDCHVGPPCPLAMRDERIWLFSDKGITGRYFETTVWNEPIIPTWEYRHHKNQKPLALMKRLLSWLPAASICDPFMGSGTTLRAAKDLGLRATGIEIEERYCEIAAKRMSQEVFQFE